MSFIFLDTDVASAVLRERVSDPMGRRLIGQSLAITFVTVGELRKWTLVRRWGPQRLAAVGERHVDRRLLPGPRATARHSQHQGLQGLR